jgi:hypothetical protein
MKRFCLITALSVALGLASLVDTARAVSPDASTPLEEELGSQKSSCDTVPKCRGRECAKTTKAGKTYCVGCLAGYVYNAKVATCIQCPPGTTLRILVRRDKSEILDCH